MKLLKEIQQKLVCQKLRQNTFGGYKYRSCEDILEAVKPLLGDAILTMTDEIVYIASTPTQQFQSPLAKDKQYDVDGSRFYVKATATIKCGDESVSVSAFAREPLDKKGMDESQITGTASSYARKYALNGLFGIDDSKDNDYLDNGKNAEKTILKITDAQQAYIDKVGEKLIDSLPENMAIDSKKLPAVLYSINGSYPDDLNTVGAAAKYIVNSGKIKNLCKATK